MLGFDIPGDEPQKHRVGIELRRFANDWVMTLAAGDYAGALGMLMHEYPEDRPRWPAKTDWSARRLANAIKYHGVFEDPGDLEHIFKVVPLEASLAKVFEERLLVSFQGFRMYGTPYLGAFEFDLPLDYPRGNAVGDLTARLLMRQIGEQRMALALLDVHVC